MVAKKSARKSAKKGGKKPHVGATKTTPRPRVPKQKSKHELLTECLAQMLHDVFNDHMVAIEDPTTIDDLNHHLVNVKGGTNRYDLSPLVIGRQMNVVKRKKFIENFLDGNLVLGEIEDLFEVKEIVKADASGLKPAGTFKTQPIPARRSSPTRY